MRAAAYDDIAAWYDGFVRDARRAGNFGLPHLLQLAGDVRGLRVCDVACGQGRAARSLARSGARVVGVDISGALLEIARREERAAPLGIQYLLDDAQLLASLAGERFDGAVCNLALTDIPELRAALSAVQRILRPGGWFVFCVPHPCFEAPFAEWVDIAPGQRGRLIRTYFDEGYWRADNVHGLRYRVGAYHHTLGTYLNALAGVGLLVEQALEPAADAVTAAREPGYAVVPDLWLARCVKKRGNHT